MKIATLFLPDGTLIKTNAIFRHRTMEARKPRFLFKFFAEKMFD